MSPSIMEGGKMSFDYFNVKIFVKGDRYCLPKCHVVDCRGSKTINFDDFLV
jgi:hypothetical protein